MTSGSLAQLVALWSAAVVAASGVVAVAAYVMLGRREIKLLRVIAARRTARKTEVTDHGNT